MKLEDSMWKVQFAVPSQPWPNGRVYASNRNALCLCESAEQAIELVRKMFPDATIHCVVHEGKKMVLSP